MFGIFEGTKKNMELNFGYPHRTSLIVAATLAATCESTLTPFERVQILLVDPRNHNSLKNTSDAIKKIAQKGGVGEFYRGYTVTLARNIVNTCSYFLLKEKITADGKYYGSYSEFARRFGEGALIGAIITTATLPLNVIKHAKQRNLDSDELKSWDVYRSIYILRGSKLTRMYLGASLNYIKAILHWAFLNASYDHLKMLMYGI